MFGGWVEHEYLVAVDVIIVVLVMPYVDMCAHVHACAHMCMACCDPMSTFCNQDRLRRSHDMRFALMNDEFEYSRAKLHSGVDAIRAFDTAGGKKINELEKSECVQSADGNFECFQMSHIRDPETGELQVSPSR
eukprot:COSAG05_NODE_1735_length_4177_cov_1.826876_1_plen_134_part_00